MTSLTCPNCKKHISIFDLKCFSCGFTITEEERDRQVKELEMQRSDDSMKRNSPNKIALKRLHMQKFLKKLDRISFRLFKIGWADLVVPSIIFILILLVIVLLII